MRRLMVRVCLVILMPVQIVCADPFDLPVSRHNNANPFVAIHALQGYSGVKQPAVGELSSRISVDIDNEYFIKTTQNEELTFDFERTALSINLSYGLSNQLALGVDLPFMINSGGFLDGLIENWHDLFGLNQGGRTQADRDAFLIAYSGDDQSVRVDASDQGVGDISLYADRLLLNTDAYRLKARTVIKLPTGDEKQLFGSGGYGLSLHINAAAKVTEKLTGFGGAGLSYLSSGDILSADQNNLVAAATLGISWQPKSALRLSAQLDFNSKVYDDTDLDAISGQAGVLYVSARYTFSNQSVLQFGFTEDVINKDAAPDFGIRLGFEF